LSEPIEICINEFLLEFEKEQKAARNHSTGTWVAYTMAGMAWIKQISLEEATGSLKLIYEGSIKRAGRIFNIVRAQSLRPSTLKAGIELYAAAVLAPSELSRRQQEMLAVVVSSVNGCHY
jgi:hypothetical protein